MSDGNVKPELSEEPDPKPQEALVSQSAVSGDPLSGYPQWVRLLDLWKWPLAVMFVCVVALAGYVISLKAAKDTASAMGRRVTSTIETAKDAAAEIVERFHAGYITETFTSAIPELSSNGMKLELANMQSVETFRRSEAKTALWDSVYLGTTTTEIRVPVTYRYHLDLVGPWKLDVEGNSCIVVAPKFQAAQPPTIHTHRMQKWSERGWARFNEEEQMRELERSITPSISRYAEDGRHRELVREECRKQVAEFVRDWLLRENQWSMDRFSSIRVVFADETDRKPEQFAPTIRIQEPLPEN